LRYDVQVVIDVDLANYFGAIDHRLLVDMLSEKIGDERLMRYLIRMFKAGILAEGELTVSDEGLPQGSICSPVLANVFAHYDIDTWFEDMVKRHCKGRVALFRYADEAIICCQYGQDATRIKVVLGERLTKYHLHLNEEKTRLLPFAKEAQRRGDQQGAFDFLGFTFYWGRSRRGAVIPKLRTSGKRYAASSSGWTSGRDGCVRYSLCSRFGRYSAPSSEDTSNTMRCRSTVRR